MYWYLGIYLITCGYFVFCNYRIKESLKVKTSAIYKLRAETNALKALYSGTNEKLDELRDENKTLILEKSILEVENKRLKKLLAERNLNDDDLILDRPSDAKMKDEQLDRVLKAEILQDRLNLLTKN